MGSLSDDVIGKGCACVCVRSRAWGPQARARLSSCLSESGARVGACPAAGNGHDSSARAESCGPGRMDEGEKIPSLELPGVGMCIFWARCRQSAKQVTGLSRGVTSVPISSFFPFVCSRKLVVDQPMFSFLKSECLITFHPALLLMRSAIDLRHPENPTANGQ